MGWELPTFFIRYDSIHWFWLLVSLNIPLAAWLYSTITSPIKKGYKLIIDWKQTIKGRNLAAIFSGIPFFVMGWAVCARYVQDNYSATLLAIDVTNTHPHLLFTNFSSVLGILYFAPVLGTGFALFLGIRHFMKYEDIREQFYEWEFRPLSKVAFSLEDDSADVIVGWEKDSKKPIVLKENERYIHKLVNGATGSGKTSTQLLVEITQDLVRIARGQKLSVVMLEPKGDAVADILEICDELEIPREKIKVVDPTDKIRSIKFNPFSGPLEAAAESFRGALDSLTGDQDSFFRGQQGETASMFTMLAKLRYGNRANILHIQQMFTDARYLGDMAEEVREEIEDKISKWRVKEQSLSAQLNALKEHSGDPHERLKLSDELEGIKHNLKDLEKHSRIVAYFEDEVLEYKTYRDQKTGDTIPVTYSNGKYEGRQVVDNKKDKYITGAKKYLNDIAMNTMLTDLMVGNDDEALDLDQFLDEGGILLVNSALGELEELSLLLGQFFTRQFQSAVFRRPSEKDGNYKRIPTFFTIDEFPLYANEAFERFLTLGRSYKVGVTIAIQSLGQLERIVPGYRQVIMANSSTKVVFGRGVYDDNLIFSNEFGEEYEYEESLNESTTPVTVGNPSWSYRHNTQRKLIARFTPTQIRELKFKHMIVSTVKEDGSAAPPVHAIGRFLNETDFIDKYLDVSSLTLRTKESNPLDIGAAVSKFRELITPPTKEEAQSVHEGIEPSIPAESTNEDDEYYSDLTLDLAGEEHKEEHKVLNRKEVNKEEGVSKEIEVVNEVAVVKEIPKNVEPIALFNENDSAASNEEQLKPTLNEEPPTDTTAPPKLKRMKKPKELGVEQLSLLDMATKAQSNISSDTKVNELKVPSYPEVNEIVEEAKEVSDPLNEELPFGENDEVVQEFTNSIPDEHQSKNLQVLLDEVSQEAVITPPLPHKVKSDVKDQPSATNKHSDHLVSNFDEEDDDF